MRTLLLLTLIACLAPFQRSCERRYEDPADCRCVYDETRKRNVCNSACPADRR